MDKILEGTLGSNHPNELKMALAEKIIQSAATVEDVNVILNVLKCCTDTILNGKSDFNVRMTKQILNGWARVHWDLAGKVLSEEMDIRLSKALLTNQELTEEKRKFLEFVLLLMSTLRSANGDPATCNLLNKIVSCFLYENEVKISCLMAEIALRNWNVCCIKEREGELMLKIIDLLRSYSLKFDMDSNKSTVVEEITKRVHQVNTISAFFSKIIETDSKFAQFALAEIFNAISQDKLPASITLTPLLCCMPSEYAGFAAASICKNSKVKDKNVELVLCKMIDWLAWPDCRKLDVWIVTLCKALVADGERQRLIAAIIKKKAVVVFNHLFSPVSRENALSVFSYMMLLYKHSPEIFHLLAPRMPSLFIQIERDSNGLAKHMALKTIAELVYTLMYKFPGYPDIYTTLADALKMYPKPTEADMIRWLESSGHVGADVSISPRKELALIKKQIPGKTGLNNLGNTCYMNSVIQALYMLKSFCGHLLSIQLTKETDPITWSLQKLFAFLLLSERADLFKHFIISDWSMTSFYTVSALSAKLANIRDLPYIRGLLAKQCFSVCPSIFGQAERPAISPNDFYKISRPPWFRPGAQQDCSEFLKYLLERVEQEDKGRSEGQAKQKESNTTKAGLHDMFTGECRVDVKCLNCHFISSRFEAFNDLPLAFPDTIEDGKRAFPLKGGDISREVLRNRVKETGGIPVNETKDALDPESVTPMEEAQSSFAIPSEERQNIGLSNGDEQKIPLNLQSLLESYLSTETLDGQNQYRCDNCASLQDAEQRHYFTSTPKYLILTLKRFTYDIKTHTRGKILQNVHFPLDLVIPVQTEVVQEDELSAYPNTDSMDFEESMNQIDTDIKMDCEGFAVGLDINTKPVLKVVGENSKHYSLIAVIIHSGVSSESGHYYCYCRKKPDVIRQPEQHDSDCARTDADKSVQHESIFELPNEDKIRSRTLDSCSEAVAETIKELSRKFDESTSKKKINGKCSSEKTPTGTSHVSKTLPIDPSRDITKAGQRTLNSSEECNESGIDSKEFVQKQQKHVPCSDWYLFNDSIVASVKETDLEMIQKDHPRDTPYVFVYEESTADLNCPFLSDDEIRPEISFEVEADNRQYRKEQQLSSKRPLYNAALHSKTRRRDNDKDDDSYGGGPSGNCGGAFGGFSSNAGRFIY